MKMTKATSWLSCATLALALQATAHADEDYATRVCKGKITDEYHLDDFRNVWAEQLGHHKWKIHGRVGHRGDYDRFDCTIQEGQVRSYHYEGSHSRYHDDDDDDTSDSKKAAVAIGAGLAIAALVAAARSSSGSDKSHREDDCSDELSRRLRRDHHKTASVHIRDSQSEGDELYGSGRVSWDHSRGNRIEFSCWFNDRDFVVDSEYKLY